MDMLLSFITGLFMANGIPHFVNGISGRPFHSPFAKPPIKGTSCPFSNVLWGLLNFVTAVVLIHFIDRLKMGLNWNFVLFSAGFASTSLFLSVLFRKMGK